MRLAIGQIWEDCYLTGRDEPWLVRVMKLNEKSVRVEPCDALGVWVGYSYQYRMENIHFERGRMKLVHDVVPA